MKLGRGYTQPLSLAFGVIMTSNPKEYGAIVNRLVGQECERTLACNSLKLRFNVDRDFRGDQYIWIDPPWDLERGNIHITSSQEYSDDRFDAWSELLNPLNRTKFISWEQKASGATIFNFTGDYSLHLPPDYEQDEDYWYDHWYARDKSTEQSGAGDGEQAL